MATSDREALKRLGGGRWETKDGRFTIEPQSGTWVVVDNTATNELGLPLVTGPYGSLTAAREAIDGARDTDTPTSPLAAEIERAKERAAEAPAEPPAEPEAARAKRRAPEPAVDEPAEPRWLTDLDAADAKRARILLRKLERTGLADAERVARDELTKDQPAVARVAIARRLAEITADADDVEDAVRLVVELLADGRDRELGVGWSLVDDAGREVGTVEPAEG